MTTETMVADRVENLGGFLGGWTFVAHDREELAAVRALAWESKSLLDILVYLARPELRSELLSQFRAAWEENEEAYGEALRNLLRADPEEERPVDRLRLALELGDRIWTRELEMGSEELALAVAVADAGEAGAIELELEEPALVLHEGSFTVALELGGRTALAVGPWAISFFRRRGAFPASIARNLKEDFRESMEKKVSEAERSLLVPPRLDEMGEGALAGQRGVVVLLHGLLSTDVGTFDGFLRGWHEEPYLRSDDLSEWKAAVAAWRAWCAANGREAGGRDPGIEDFNRAARQAAGEYAVVGWPHDTLTGIADNAYGLSTDLERALGADGVPFIFVCHSRGGLLARRAALDLTSDRYRERLRGCVTFGTPHEGAEMADLSGWKYLAAFVAVMSALRVRSFWTLTDVLAYRRGKGTIQGIEDLKEASSPGFLQDLRSDEGASAPEGRKRALDILAVGGNYTGQDSVQVYAARRFFGLEEEHDLVVNLRSSAPASIPERVRVECDHGGYCLPPVTETVAFGRAIRYVRELLGFDEVVYERVRPSGGSIEVGDDYVDVGDVRLRQQRE